MFIHGQLKNLLNVNNGWRAQIGYRDRWKEAVYRMLVATGYRMGMVDPKAPKRITIVGHVARRFDSKTEGLRAALKPFPDALQHAKIIDNDGDGSAHEFIYDQVPDRACRGVYIKVEFLG